MDSLPSSFTLFVRAKSPFSLNSFASSLTFYNGHRRSICTTAISIFEAPGWMVTAAVALITAIPHWILIQKIFRMNTEIAMYRSLVRENRLLHSS